MDGRSSGDQHQIDRGQSGELVANRLSQPPFDLVAQHRFTHLRRNDKTHARHRRISRGGPRGLERPHQIACGQRSFDEALALLLDSKELRAAQQPRSLGEGEGAGAQRLLRRRLHGEPLAALRPAALENRASLLRGHPLAKPVLLVSPHFARLIRTLHGTTPIDAEKTAWKKRGTESTRSNGLSRELRVRAINSQTLRMRSRPRPA